MESTGIFYFYYGEKTVRWIRKGMIVDLTARFDYDTGWSYLFIVYCRSGRFGQSSCFGHVTVHSQLGFDQLELCLTCPKKANCCDLAAQAEVAGRRARGQIPF